jgi:hypothetical protein
MLIPMVIEETARGREAKKRKKAKDQRAPAKSSYERTPPKPTPAAPDNVQQR